METKKIVTKDGKSKEGETIVSRIKVPHIGPRPRSEDPIKFDSGKKAGRLFKSNGKK